ncbi:NAD(P)-dependent alcohol dehydrogenase [Spirillospora sp. CA-128828]|uniref:NAD(P)-dependent alcohol dehydrogenase n=1 Tax=Spirillospora sp. CA-128828 TaxID=3240033 RepID=UPI003D9110EB
MVSIRAAVVRDKGAPFAIEELSLAEPRPDEVLVRTVATGVCHTDLLTRDQILPPGPPAVLGHEGSGVVEAVGPAVTSVAVGDTVVLGPISCGGCRNCLRGHPMSCETFMPMNFGGRRADGSTGCTDATGAEVNAHYFGQSSFGSHMLTHQRCVVKVPAGAPLELLGPLGCGLQTGAGAVLNSLNPPAGSSIAVFGAGGVGLAAVMAAALTGCSTIIVVDLQDSRLALARELGATHTVNAGAEDAVARIQEITGGGADFSLDAVGLPLTARQAVDAVNIGGTAGIVGAAGFGSEIPIDLATLLTSRTVKGIVEGDSVPQLFVPTLIELYLAGRFPFDRLVRTYAFDEINKAVEDAESGETIKPVLVF